MPLAWASKRYVLYQVIPDYITTSSLEVFEGSTQPHFQFAMNTMKMLYLFLSLLASQLSLGSPFMIRKEQNENGVETVSSGKSKTASLSTDTKEQPFLIMEGPKAPSKASSPGRYQAKCKRNNFNLLSSLKKYT